MCEDVLVVAYVSKSCCYLQHARLKLTLTRTFNECILFEVILDVEVKLHHFSCPGRRGWLAVHAALLFFAYTGPQEKVKKSKNPQKV